MTTEEYELRVRLADAVADTLASELAQELGDKIEWLEKFLKSFSNREEGTQNFDGDDRQYLLLRLIELRQFLTKYITYLTLNEDLKESA